MNSKLKSGVGIGLAVAALAIALPGTANALAVSSTDLWNFDNGSTVTAHSGTCCSTNINNMFGARLFSNGSSAVGSGTEADQGNTLFTDGRPTGFLHSVEWQTASAVTLRSFILNAFHDGAPRDANARGFSTFRLFAFNTATSAFDLIFAYSPANPYGNSIAPANGIVENAIGTFVNNAILSLGVNLDPVVASRFRAEFVQFGFFAFNASGPRIVELDGFDTFIDGATAPSPVPVPAALPLLAAGMALLGGLRLRRRRLA